MSPVNFSHLRTPNFERLKTTLFGGQADSVPLIELGIHPKIKEACLGRPIVTVADDAEFMSNMGYDFVKIQPAIKFQLEKEKSTQKKEADEKLDGGSWATTQKGIISDWEDFEKYPWPKKEDIDYSRLEEAEKGLPEGMAVVGQYGDIFTVIWEMMGFEEFSIATFEEPELIEALFNKVGELVYSMFETMADMDWVQTLWYSDDIAYTSGLMISPQFLRGHLFPWLKKIGDLAAKREIPLIYHTDGVLWEVFDDIVNCGVKAQHPIEPLAMDITEVKARMGDKLCLCGNIDVDILARGTEEQVAELVKQRIKEIAPGGGYCLSSSNSIAGYTKVENYIAMVKTALEVGKY